MTLNAPTPVVSRRVYLPPITIGYPVPTNNLAVTVVRYIKDPIATGGCPQCGTFLYKEYGAKELESDDVFTGRNFSIRKEDKFYFCARCNFPVKPKRHPSMKKGSYAGWGMKYDEIEAGESDISYP